MGVFSSILSTDDLDVVYECRSCGTTVESENASCPYCDVADVVRYDVT